MEKIYQGESLNLVFRCKHRCGTPVDMRGTVVSALLRDSFGEVVWRFSTSPVAEGVKRAVMDRNYVVCRLSREDTVGLSGSYALEVKVTQGKGELVMIETVKGIKIYSSTIGEEVNL